MKKDDNRKDRAARIGRYTPAGEPIRSFEQLADLIRHLNSYGNDHWTLNDSLFFGDFGGSYATSATYHYLYIGSVPAGARGFVEIPDSMLEDYLRRLLTSEEEFYFGAEQNHWYAFDHESLFRELKTDGDNK